MCDACGAPLHPPVVESTRYRCGLPNVTLTNVQVQRCSACDNAVVDIPNLAGLHKQLAYVVANQGDRLSAAEFRFLRKYLGWSGVDSAKRLGSTPESVSRWENGRAPIPGPTERLLRVLVLHQQPVEWYADMLDAIGRGHREDRFTATLLDDHWSAAREACSAS